MDNSPVFENFMNKMSAMSGRPKINKNTFKIGSPSIVRESKIMREKLLP